MAAILNKDSQGGQSNSDCCSKTYWCAHRWLSANNDGKLYTVPAGYITQAMWQQMFGVTPGLTSSNPF